MDKITLEMTPAEALFALAAIQSSGAKAHHNRRMLLDTGAPIDETGIAETSAQMYDRLERRISDQLYPPTLTDPVRRHILEQELELGLI